MKKTAVILSLLVSAVSVLPAFSESSGFTGFDMVDFLPDEGKQYIEYVIGEHNQPYKEKRYLDGFEMNRYETTYNLWYSVRKWAESQGYYFQNPGQEGSEGARGRAPSEYFSALPVTSINWYDAVVWCNAFSEFKGRQPCYTYDGEVLRDSGNTAVLDLAVCDWNADGYRLPTEAEWEYAARKTSSGLQRGDFASGQVNEKGESDASIPMGEVAWYCDNSKGTHVVGTAGTPFEDSPNPGSGNPDGAGLFDMSGNVLELCWDWEGNYQKQEKGVRAAGPEYGAERILRGGSWSPFSMFLFTGDRYSFDPNEAYNYMGFRICSSVTSVTSENK